MIALAPLLGYLIGSMPTANGIARMFGVNLRTSGSGNPGANNARRVGGIRLAAIVLLVEMSKGALAVIIGTTLGGETGAVLAGIASITGNIYNMWYRFDGGKGLSITGGVLLAAWPLAFPALVVLIAIALLLTRSSGYATLIALGGAILLSVAWQVFHWPQGWGLESRGMMVILSLALALLLTPRHLYDARHPLR